MVRPGVSGVRAETRHFAGKHELQEIGEVANLPFREIKRKADALVHCGLLQEDETGSVAMPSN
jgi:hypothetical protein